jgi:hypothetical protein
MSEQVQRRLPDCTCAYPTLAMRTRMDMERQECALASAISACGQVATAETRTPNIICPGGNTGRTVGAEFGVLAVVQLQM